MEYEKLFRFNLKLRRLQNNNEEMTDDGVRHPKVSENTQLIVEMQGIVNELCEAQIVREGVKWIIGSDGT